MKNGVPSLAVPKTSVTGITKAPPSTMEGYAIPLEMVPLRAGPVMLPPVIASAKSNISASFGLDIAIQKRKVGSVVGCESAKG